MSSTKKVTEMVTAAAPSPVRPYPVHVEARAPQQLSRWLWLVKWLLAIPHYVVLVLLWMAFVLLSAVALVAIVATGRYPRSIFEFNVGVLRWTWRVTYYAYGALATDQYPPFTLAEVPEYPAHLEVEYPERLSRGLALVKWWLLAIPHYLVVGLLLGSGTWVVRWTTDSGWRWEGGGLIAILAIVAGVVVLATGAYPRGLYDLLLGLNRWVIRVAAYAGLMTDVYPPFRLDMGEHDGGTLLTGPAPSGPASSGPASSGPAPSGPAPWAAGPAGHPPPGGYGTPPGGYGTPPGGYGTPPRARWTNGRVLAVVLGALLAVVGLGGVAAGGTLAFGYQFLREDGFVTTPPREVSSDGYAVVLGEFEVHADGLPLDWPQRLFGEVRVRATAPDGDDVFLGITSADDAGAYLDGARHHVATGPGNLRLHDGSAPVVPPADVDIWLAEATGPGTQEIRTDLVDGTWVVVVMAPDGSAGVDAAVDVGATVPWARGAATLLLAAGLVGTVAGAAVIVAASRRAVRG